MPSKEDLLHDINIVLLLSSKQDMSDSSTVQKTLNYLEQKKTLKTPIGSQYLQRLRQICEGSSPDTCYLCKTNKAHDGILCTACMTKYSHGEITFYKKETQEVHQVQNEPKEKAFDPKSVGKTVKSFINQEIVQQPDGSSVKNYAGKYSRLSIVALILSIVLVYAGFLGSILGVVDLLRKDGRKRALSIASIVIGAIWLIIGIGSISSCARSPGGNDVPGEIIESDTGDQLDVDMDYPVVIHDVAEAEQLLKLMYPESEGWSVSNMQETQYFPGYFWTPLGRTTGYAENAIQQIFTNLASCGEAEFAKKLITYFYQPRTCYQGMITKAYEGGTYVFVSPYGRVLRPLMPADPEYDPYDRQGLIFRFR